MLKERVGLGNGLKKAEASSCLNIYFHAPNWCISRHLHACYQKETIPSTDKSNFKKFVEAPNFKTNYVKLILDGESQKSGLERLQVFPLTE